MQTLDTQTTKHHNAGSNCLPVLLPVNDLRKSPSVTDTPPRVGGRGLPQTRWHWLRWSAVWTCAALIGAADQLASATAAERPGTAQIEVRADQPVHRMAGGMGASWHALHREVPFDPDRMTSGRRGAPQSSGFGGNPPLDNSAAWQDLERHFRWLSLDWCRVELAQRMYQPERDRFDWDNAEMQTLYRILDLCETNRVDVFLTQMWNDVVWNTHEGVHPLQSAPKSIPDFARGLGELCERLLRHRRYTCIRWLCINNEPGIADGWWLGLGRRVESITPALQAVREELDRRGLALPLSAPDFYTLAYIGKAPFDFDALVGAFDAHTYVESPEDYTRFTRKWVEYTQARSKPFFISEMGDFASGWQGSSAGPGLYDTQLSIARKVVPPFFEEVGKSLPQSSKVHLADLGLACHLLGSDSAVELAKFWGTKSKRRN
jgi:hypothetical protein